MSDGARVDAVARTHDGDVYVFAANIRREPVRATLKLDGVRGNARVTVVDESRGLTMRGGTIVDEFGALGVHIYKVTPGE